MSIGNHERIRRAVRNHYSSVSKQGDCSCTSSSCCSSNGEETAISISAILGYSEEELLTVPKGANLGLGCGNPQAIASLKPGEWVLDLGSGGGFDCFLAARSVGESGHVIGVDMTAAMVSKARGNLERSHFKNIEFQLGEIEALPVPDGIIDVIISNCVINLSPEKEKVFSEAFRVLKRGGRLAIADMVRKAEVPQVVLEDFQLYSQCISGASSVSELESLLSAAGFVEIHITPKNESREFIADWVPGHHIEDYVLSAMIEAVKP